jgi:hypothetical protein
VDIKGQQPSILVNPLRHNGIIGWHPEKGEAISLPGNGLALVTPEELARCWAFVQVRKELVTRGGVWNPGYR